MRILASLSFCAMVMLVYALPAVMLGMIVPLSPDAAWQEILTAFGISLAGEALILGPLMLGMQYALLAVARQTPRTIGMVFAPLADVQQLLRGIRMVLCMMARAFLLAAVPTALYIGEAYAFSRWAGAQGEISLEVLLGVIAVLLTLYCILLLPAAGRMLSYHIGYAVLYDNPDMGVWRATAEGSRLLRGQRAEMIKFALSFAPWMIGGLFTLGLLSLYGMIYMNVSVYILGDRLREAQQEIAPAAGQNPEARAQDKRQDTASGGAEDNAENDQAHNN